MSATRKIKPEVKTVYDIFDNNSRYQFDYYQRNYSWGEQQITDLIDDLWEAYQKSPNEEYYLSNILLAPRVSISSSDLVYSVVDGQQRLTSLCLLLAVGYRIAHKAVSHGVPAELKSYQYFFVDLLRRIRKEDEITYRLLHNDFEDLMAILIEADGKTIASKNTKEQMHSISPTIGNMYDRFLDIYSALSDKVNSSYGDDLAKSNFDLFETERDKVSLGENNEVSKMLEFFKWVLNNVAFIAVYAEDLDKAYNIFTTQNDRGLPLTSADLLKSNLLSHISESARVKAVEVWNSMYKNLLSAMGPKAIHEFFRDYLRAKYALAAVGDKSYDQMADPGGYHRWLIENRETMRITDSNSIKDFVTKELPFFANIYIFMHEKTKDKNYDESFDSLYFLSKLGYPSGFQAMLVMSAISIEDSQQEWEDKIRILTRTLETYVVRRLWSELNWKQNFIKKDVIELAKLFRKKKDIDYIKLVCNDLLVADYPDTDRALLNLNNTLRNATSPFSHAPFSIEPVIKSSNLKFFRLILARITHYVERNAAPNNYADLNRFALPKDYELEHILPKDYESYSDTYLSEEEYDTARNKIGAMLVIPKINNNSYQDKLIEDKIEDYLRNDPYLAKILSPKFDELGAGNGIQKWSNFITTHSLREYINPILGNVLSPNDIELRTELYKKLCTIVWANSYEPVVYANKEESGDTILRAYKDNILTNETKIRNIDYQYEIQIADDGSLILIDVYTNNKTELNTLKQACDSIGTKSSAAEYWGIASNGYWISLANFSRHNGVMPEPGDGSALVPCGL